MVAVSIWWMSQSKFSALILLITPQVVGFLIECILPVVLSLNFDQARQKKKRVRGSTYIHIHSESLNDIAGLEDSFWSCWAEKKSENESGSLDLASRASGCLFGHRSGNPIFL